MPGPFPISSIAAALALPGWAFASAPPLPRAPEPAPQAIVQAQPPSDAEVRERAAKLTANQHADDEAFEEYERIEHHVDRTGGANPRVLEDRTYRVVPTGTGTMKLLLKENGKAAEPAEYHRQLQFLAETLALMLKPADSRAKTAYAKYEKKKRDRADVVNSVRDAFTVKWLGREIRNGRDCDVIELVPNPNFRPRSMVQDVLTHATAKIWIEHTANQMVHGEAHVVRDISFGGGILGKVYRGGVISLDQEEFSPGLWMPTRYQYDFMGRKFLFTFDQHQYIEVSRFHRIGPPKQALAAVQTELAGGKPAIADP